MAIVYETMLDKVLRDRFLILNIFKIVNAISNMLILMLAFENRHSIFNQYAYAY